MKVVLFCGGLGSRLSSVTSEPKPLIRVGEQSLLWNLMRYYSHFGHRDFVLCTGHGADRIRHHFETAGAAAVERLGVPRGEPPSLWDWSIRFVDSGIDTTIGERLLAARCLLEPDECFLANYGDVLSDFDLPVLVRRVTESSAVCGLLSVPLAGSFHLVQQAGSAVDLTPVNRTGLRINGGFFVFRREVFDYMQPGEDLVDGALTRLGARGGVLAHEYDGFWHTVDTPKDLAHLEGLLAKHDPAPWELWKRGAPGAPGSTDRERQPAGDALGLEEPGCST